MNRLEEVTSPMNRLEEQDMDHVRGASYHPMTQGKIERGHQTLKNRILLEHYSVMIALDEVRPVIASGVDDNSPLVALEMPSGLDRLLLNLKICIEFDSEEVASTSLVYADRERTDVGMVRMRFEDQHPPL